MRPRRSARVRSWMGRRRLRKHWPGGKLYDSAHGHRSHFQPYRTQAILRFRVHHFNASGLRRPRLDCANPAAEPSVEPVFNTAQQGRIPLFSEISFPFVTKQADTSV